ncbi:MAG: pyocin activator PrtN family protein [Thioclava sp.]|nr:pyocin activator PrtN family protein [Thioclava sp.]MBD3804722.1 pyocin activator PrtN family protein [Thioclava sp.]
MNEKFDPLVPRLELQLMGLYEGSPLIAIEELAERWFNLTPAKLLQKCSNGAIDLIITPLGNSQKAKKVVTAHDFAVYVAHQRAAAEAERQKLLSW